MGAVRTIFVIVVTLAILFIPGIARTFMEQPESEETLVEVEEEEIPLELKGGSAEVGFDIREDIRRGQKFLENRTAGHTVVREQKRVVVFNKKRKRKREKLITRKIIRPNFLLAVEDLKERKIREVLITDKGCATKGFEVTKHRGSGVGSRFEVKYPENMAVLALRTTVRSGRNSFKEVVYTPYSPVIDTARVRQDGIDYLTRQIELARRDLEERRVRLAGFSRLAPDATPADIPVILPIIEHIDPVRFINAQKGKEIVLAHEVLTIIGANTTNAYAYAKSPAGARGLFQFVPDTYKRLQKKYPHAALMKDFISGCNDHVNAAKASLLLLDADLASVSDARLSTIGKDARSTGAYLAASYNCGLGRVEKSAKQCGDEWTCRLPEETKIYLKKLDVVWDSGIANGK